MAKRWASSRTRCRRYRASLVRGMTTGSGVPGTYPPSIRLASDTTARSGLAEARTASRAAASWGRPPSTTIRLGGEANFFLRPVSSSGWAPSVARRARRRGRPPRRGAPAGARDPAQGGHVVLALDRADLEAAVLALAGQAVLEHHHRAHDLVALEVGDVVALDPQRRLGQVERLLELLEAAGPGVEVAGPLELVGGEGLAGVGRDRLQQGPVLPPAGHPEVARPPAQPGQPGPQRLGPLGLDRQEDLAGDLVGPVAVELLHEGRGQGRGVEGLDLVDREPAPAHDPAAADEEHLHRRLQVVLGEGGDVEVLG